MKPLTFLFFAIVSAGCGSAVVRTEFKTVEAAKQANAFSRGWLPPVLPAGTTRWDIKLDLKNGEGTYAVQYRQKKPIAAK